MIPIFQNDFFIRWVTFSQMELLSVYSGSLRLVECSLTKSTKSVQHSCLPKWFYHFLSVWFVLSKLSCQKEKALLFSKNFVVAYLFFVKFSIAFFFHFAQKWYNNFVRASIFFSFSSILSFTSLIQSLVLFIISSTKFCL